MRYDEPFSQLETLINIVQMTGLDVFKDHIIEICAIVTDGDLNLVDEGYESVIHYGQSEMDKMNEWCIEHHGQVCTYIGRSSRSTTNIYQSGLTKKVVESNKTLDQVQQEILEYLKRFANKGKAVLAGNSVHMDRAFMMRELPTVLEHLHYRIIDVSSIYEFGQRHNPELIKKIPKKREAHTAKADILESIAQLKWYRDNYLISP